MQPEQRLIRNIREAAGPKPLTVYQGIVASVEGITCTVTFSSQEEAEKAGYKLCKVCSGKKDKSDKKSKEKKEKPKGKK